MAEAIVRTQSPTEYFRELVESAMQNQRVSAHELTSFYVVNLLTTFVHRDRAPGAGNDEALGVTLARAMQAAGIRVISKDGALVEWDTKTRNVFVKDPNGFLVELVGTVAPQ